MDENDFLAAEVRLTEVQLRVDPDNADLQAYLVELQRAVDDGAGLVGEERMPTTSEGVITEGLLAAEIRWANERAAANPNDPHYQKYINELEAGARELAARRPLEAHAFALHGRNVDAIRKVAECVEYALDRTPGVETEVRMTDEGCLMTARVYEYPDIYADSYASMIVQLRLGRGWGPINSLELQDLVDDILPNDRPMFRGDEEFPLFGDSGSVLATGASGSPGRATVPVDGRQVFAPLIWAGVVVAMTTAVELSWWDSSPRYAPGAGVGGRADAATLLTRDGGGVSAPSVSSSSTNADEPSGGQGDNKAENKPEPADPPQPEIPSEVPVNPPERKTEAPTDSSATFLPITLKVDSSYDLIFEDIFMGGADTCILALDESKKLKIIAKAGNPQDRNYAVMGGMTETEAKSLIIALAGRRAKCE